MLKRATKEAGKSIFERARMGAVVSNKNRILSCGHNEIRHYKNCPTPRKWKNSLHAEQSAILKMLNKGRHNELIGSTLHVSRILKDGTPALAKPCELCQDLIIAVGIKRVFYTTENGVKSYEP